MKLVAVAVATTILASLAVATVAANPESIGIIEPELVTMHESEGLGPRLYLPLGPVTLCLDSPPPGSAPPSNCA